jgi:hypothetical protein
MYELPVLPVRDHRYYRSEQIWRRYELPVLPVRDRYYRWLTEEGTVLRENKLPVEPDRYYRYVFILNLTFRSRTDLFLDRFLDVENLENKP